MNIGKTYISPFNSNGLHYSCEIHPYVSEFQYICKKSCKLSVLNEIYINDKFLFKETISRIADNTLAMKLLKERCL